MSFIHDPEETRAVALVGISLGYAFAGILKRMGVLDPEAMEDAFEAALSGVESGCAADDPSGLLARQLLELMSAQLAAHVAPLDPGAHDRRTGLHIAVSSA